MEVLGERVKKRAGVIFPGNSSRSSVSCPLRANALGQLAKRRAATLLFSDGDDQQPIRNKQKQLNKISMHTAYF